MFSSAPEPPIEGEFYGFAEVLNDEDNPDAVNYPVDMFVTLDNHNSGFVNFA